MLMTICCIFVGIVGFCIGMIAYNICHLVYEEIIGPWVERKVLAFKDKKRPEQKKDDDCFY